MSAGAGSSASFVLTWPINQSSPYMETIDSAKMRACNLSAGAAHE